METVTAADSGQEAAKPHVREGMMKYACVIVASLLIGVPALAQQGGLPVTQGQVNALQAQIDSLQTSLLALQKQVNGLSSLVGWDDGTAQALVGTWTGSVNSIEFRRAVVNPGPGLPLNFENFFYLYPGGPGGNPSGPQPGFTVVQPQNSFPVTVQVNPEMWLARAPFPQTTINFTITRDGMKLSGSGVATNPSPEPSQNFTLTGIVLSNNFFLLKIRVGPTSGPCVPASGFVIFQAVGSLNADTRLGGVLTGSGVDANCQHSVFRVGLTKR